MIPNFTSNTVSGKVPLRVSFYDISIGSVSSWLWSFGDGFISYSKNPTHLYTEPGFYTVTLTINGTLSETKENYVQVLYPLYTYDEAVNPDNVGLHLISVRGSGGKSFLSHGIRILILKSDENPEESGFSRENGPSVIFD